MVALAGLSLLACNKETAPIPEEEKTPVVQEYSYTIAVDADTKAYLDGDHMTWETGNQIGWFTDKAGHSAINMSTDPRSFQVNSTSVMAAGATIYAYAPYTTEGTVTAAPLSIPTTQDGVITNAMPLVSLPITLAADMDAGTDTPAGQASFLGLGAIIEYNVYTSEDAYGTEKVQSVQFTSTSNIAGDFTVNLTTVAEDAIPAPSGLDQKTVTSTLSTATTVGDSKANGIKVYQVVAPGDYTGDVIVYTDKASYRFHIASAKTFTRGKIKPLNVDLKKGSRIARPYSHSFAIGDWGIGSDPTGHPDGDYYMDWGLVNPDVLDGASWTWDVIDNSNSDFDAGGFFKYLDWPTIQIGSYGQKISDFILSSNSFPGTIKKVSINLEVDGNIDISCKVGGNSFGSSVNLVAGTAEFTGSACGVVAITLHSSVLTPAWLYNVAVEYEP